MSLYKNLGVLIINVVDIPEKQCIQPCGLVVSIVTFCLTLSRFVYINWPQNRYLVVKKAEKLSQDHEFRDFIGGLNDVIKILFIINSMVFHAIKPMT